MPDVGTAGAAQVTVTATNQTDPSATQILTIDIQQAPAIVSAPSAVFVVGADGTFTVTATGSPAPALSETGALPHGLTFTDNGDGTATITGTPADGSARDYEVQVSAINGAQPDATQTLTLKVKQAPVFTSPATATFQVGVAGSFTLTADAVPPATFMLTGALPPGLRFTDNGDGTATIAGTPSPGSSGDYTVTISAVNDLTDPEMTLTLTVQPAAQPTTTTTTPPPNSSTPGSSSASSSVPQLVTASETGAASGTNSSGTLARTGTETGLLVASALGLLVTGALLMSLSCAGSPTSLRRRATRH
jgi:hypothetical protein